MDIKSIINTYGVIADYYDMNSGRIYKFSMATYNPDTNKSSIPVSLDGDIIGTVTIDGDIRKS